MKFIKISLIAFLIISSVLDAFAANPKKKDIESPPPRIIRACCAFGTDLKLMAIPFARVNQITSIEDLGKHQFLGNSEEGNGLIYTRRGGFIDIGHLRDQADWTNYLYSLILGNRDKEEVDIKLGNEGGCKKLKIKTNTDLDSSDCMLLAGKIAYDLSLWHELSTWFGASYIPMMPERYSSFSVEDAYSNLLGVKIGIEALKSKLDYNEVMTSMIYSTLVEFGAVSTEEETKEALEVVRGIWWTNEKRLPNNKVILKHDADVYSSVSPWILPEKIFEQSFPEVLNVPSTTSKGYFLTDYYELNIDLNYKFPIKKLFPHRESRLITQNDFEAILIYISSQLESDDLPTMNPKPSIAEGSIGNP